MHGAPSRIAADHRRPNLLKLWRGSLAPTSAGANPERPTQSPPSERYR
jgi:hypothetical protein